MTDYLHIISIVSAVYGALLLATDKKEGFFFWSLSNAYLMGFYFTHGNFLLAALFGCQLTISLTSFIVKNLNADSKK